MSASMEGHEGVVNALLSARAKVNPKDNVCTLIFSFDLFIRLDRFSP